MTGLGAKTGAITAGGMMGDTPAAAASAPGPEPEANASPEEQAEYDAFVKNGMELLYPREGGSVAPAVLAQLKGQGGPDLAELISKADPPLGNNPVDNLAATGAALVLGLEASAAGAQKVLSPDVLLHGGKELMEQLVEVAEAAKIHDFSEDEMEQALYRAVDLYRSNSAMADPDAMRQEFGQFVEADRAGTLDQLLPGIGQRIGAAGAAPQEQGR